MSMFLNVSQGAAEKNTEIRRKQNSLFPEGPVIINDMLHSWKFWNNLAVTVVVGQHSQVTVHCFNLTS